MNILDCFKNRETCRTRYCPICFLKAVKGQKDDCLEGESDIYFV